MNLLCRIGVSGGEFVKEEERREEIEGKKKKINRDQPTEHRRLEPEPGCIGTAEPHRIIN